jgi:predicted alpha-1,6-mannanase (GH76 family)
MILRYVSSSSRLLIYAGIAVFALAASVSATGADPPKPMPPSLQTASVAAVRDLLRHFWVGDAESGHLVDTWNGYPRQDDPRGVIWERAMFVVVLDSLYKATRDLEWKRRIAADWTHVRQSWTADERESCGSGSPNPAQDDAGWAMLMYLTVHRVTGDPEALKDAKALFLRACDRWSDDQLGGGAWYSDDRKRKSSYQGSLIVAGLQLYERTHDQQFLSKAQALYDWCESHLLRPDGLYWCEVGRDGPLKSGSVRQASSETFLAGNMAMGVAHAMLFRLTKKDLYRVRAVRTADALLKRETDGEGHLLNDRDAWTNGSFMGDWVSEVLSLKGIRTEHRALIRDTARAILTKARTPKGYLSGCWNGPAEGDGCPWIVAKSLPEQIMTSAGAASVVAAALMVKLDLR